MTSEWSCANNARIIIDEEMNIEDVNMEVTRRKQKYVWQEGFISPPY